MGILDQLGLNRTFFVQFGLFAALFFIFSRTYFQPFLKLFQARHKRVVEDREAAERLLQQADSKFAEYKKRLGDERTAVRRDYELLLAEARKEESLLLAAARNEAKKLTQEAADAIHQQRERLQRELKADLEGLARQISETLLVRRD